MSEKFVETPFWLVWHPNGISPRFRHPSEGSATAEAERLARENPGREFYVLEPVSLTKRHDIITQKFTKVPF